MKLQKLLLSWFGVGYIPFAPGTFGSLATIPLIYGLSFQDYWISVLFFVILLSISIVFAHNIQIKMNVFDPGWIVVDEVLGMLVAWLFIPIWNPIYLLTLFVLFRFFDIVKIWPANWVDKKLKSGAGTILDDIVSGIYVGLIFIILRSFFPTLAKLIQIL